MLHAKSGSSLSLHYDIDSSDAASHFSDNSITRNADFVAFD